MKTSTRFLAAAALACSPLTGMAQTNAMDSCAAEYNQAEGSLFLPCVDAIQGSGQTDSYQAHLQQTAVGDAVEFSVQRILPDADRLASSCRATYFVDTGGLEVPCVRASDDEGGYAASLQTVSDQSLIQSRPADSLAVFSVTSLRTIQAPLGIGDGDADDDVAPAPPSIGADVPLTYFGPAPSDVQRELIGPFQLLNSGTVDQNAGTVTLPLYEGRMASGETVWYIITDTDDEGNAAALGLNFSPKLTYANVGRAARTGTLSLVSNGGRTTPVLEFDSGAVDFSPCTLSHTCCST